MCRPLLRLMALGGTGGTGDTLRSCWPKRREATTDGHVGLEWGSKEVMNLWLKCPVAEHE